jgi:hypothetical protein
VSFSLLLNLRFVGSLGVVDSWSAVDQPVKLRGLVRFETEDGRRVQSVLKSQSCRGIYY